MKGTTYNIIKATLDGDETLGEADRNAILASCRDPTPPAVRAASAAPQAERWLSPGHAAELLSVSLRTVQRLVRSGALPSRKVLGCRRIPASALAAPVGHPDPEAEAVHWPCLKSTDPRDFGMAERTTAV